MIGIRGDHYELFKLEKLPVYDPKDKYHDLHYYHLFLIVQLALNISYNGESKYAKP